MSDVCAVAVDLAEELHVVVRVRVVKVRREHGAAPRSLDKSDINETMQLFYVA